MTIHPLMRLLLTATVFSTFVYFAFKQLQTPVHEYYLFNAMLFIACSLVSIFSFFVFLRLLFLRSQTNCDVKIFVTAVANVRDTFPPDILLFIFLAVSLEPYTIHNSNRCY